MYKDKANEMEGLSCLIKDINENVKNKIVLDYNNAKKKYMKSFVLVKNMSYSVIKI